MPLQVRSKPAGELKRKSPCEWRLRVIFDRHERAPVNRSGMNRKRPPTLVADSPALRLRTSATASKADGPFFVEARQSGPIVGFREASPI
jgi:hypothetical protein